MRSLYNLMGRIAAIQKCPMIYGKTPEDVANIIEIYDTNSYVYVLLSNRTPIYIGQSSRIWNRIYSHMHTFTEKRQSNGFILIPVYNDLDRINLETRLIKEIKPPLNIAHNKGKKFRATATETGIAIKREA